MGNVAQFPDQSAGSYIGGFTIWRKLDGSIYGQLTDMPPHVVESIPGEPAEKMRRIADLFEEAANSLRSQAAMLEVR